MMTYTTLRITFISKLFGLFDMISQILGEPGKMGFLDIATFILSNTITYTNFTTGLA